MLPKIKGVKPEIVGVKFLLLAYDPNSKGVSYFSNIQNRTFLAISHSGEVRETTYQEVLGAIKGTPINIYSIISSFYFLKSYFRSVSTNNLFFESIPKIKEWLTSDKGKKLDWNASHSLMVMAKKDQLEQLLEGANLKFREGKYETAARVAEGMQYARAADNQLREKAADIANQVLGVNGLKGPAIEIARRAVEIYKSNL